MRAGGMQCALDLLIILFCSCRGGQSATSSIAEKLRIPHPIGAADQRLNEKSGTNQTRIGSEATLTELAEGNRILFCCGFGMVKRCTYTKRGIFAAPHGRVRASPPLA
ncbi:hypothetical protein C8R47DRAFT_675708 [Mycena vitilis]|nr:hypothetical protein C8R47DRAFT_675708 [Mycena vitilis]